MVYSGKDSDDTTGGKRIMARRCEICGKETRSGKNVSHSNKRTNRKFKPNIQNVRVVLEDGTFKRMRVCTKCLKAGKVKKYVAKVSTEV